MTGWKVGSFGGVIPRLGPRLLPNNGAQVAENSKLFSGELRSWFQTTTANVPSKGGTLNSMYRMYSTSTDYWLAWTDDVDVVRGPIAGDTAFKIYYTGDTTTATNSQAGPRKTNLALATTGGTDYPHDYLEMGVPAPASAPSITTTGGTSTTTVVRVYTYTFVTSTASWAEEGPPSPGGTATGKPDATWIVASLSTGTTGKYAFSGGVKRIYRTLTDNAGNTNYQLALDNVPMTTTSTNDVIADENLGVVCPTFINGVVGSEWIAPPSDMNGLIALPNGILAGFSGNLICFSEPFRPHAWPTRYRLASNFPVVSLGAYGQTLIVTTKGFPYAIVGSRPDSMAMTRIEENHPCVSKRSTVSFSFGVAWATPDGLALVGAGGAINAIEPFMTRDEWQAQCFPQTIIARQYQDKYFGFFMIGTIGLNFIFDKDNRDGPLTFGSYSVQGAWTDPETSKLYILQGGVIKQWDADTANPESYDWMSKIFVAPKPINLGAIQVDADYGAIGNVVTVDQQIATDSAINTIILRTSSNDTIDLPVWTALATYTTGTVVKSVDGNKMVICTVSGTASSVEPTYPSTLGGTATDGAIRWKRIWDFQGLTKGSIRGSTLRDHTQYNASDPIVDGTAGNQWGFPLRGSLLVGGTYASLTNRSLLLRIYAFTTAASSSNGDMTLVSSQYVTSRESVRLPRGFKSDEWAIRLSGNIPTRYFKIAETMEEIGSIE